MSIKDEAIGYMSSGFVQFALYRSVGSATSLAFPDNYRVFGLFRPTTILNYNLDGLAERWCGARHQVVSMHGVIPAWWGAAEASGALKAAQDYDLASLPAPEILLEPERLEHLPPLPRFDVFDVVVIVGYTFARYGDSLDDALSLNLLCAKLLATPRPVVILDPYPSRTAEMVAELAKNRHVYEAPLYWNVLAGAMLALAENGDVRQIERAYDALGNSIL